MLNQLNQEATAVLTRYGSQYLKGYFFGADNLMYLYTDLLNLHVLCGYMSELSFDGEYKLGVDVRPEAEIQYVRSMIQYYNGREDYDVYLIPNYGDGTVDPSEDITMPYRAGTKFSVSGVNEVLFYVNAELAPLPNANYIVHVWNVGPDGYMQNNVVVSGRTAAGFTVADVLDAGILYYEALLVT